MQGIVEHLNLKTIAPTVQFKIGFRYESTRSPSCLAAGLRLDDRMSVE